MKQSIRVFAVIALMACGFSSYSQKVQTPADSTTGGQELGRLKMDVASLTSQLAVAKSSLADYKAALNNNVNAKPMKQPYETASQSENHALNDLHARIFILSSEIDKKQQRLQKLNNSGIL